MTLRDNETNDWFSFLVSSILDIYSWFGHNFCVGHFEVVKYVSLVRPVLTLPSSADINDNK